MKTIKVTLLMGAFVVAALMAAPVAYAGQPVKENSPPIKEDKTNGNSANSNGNSASTGTDTTGTGTTGTGTTGTGTTGAVTTPNGNTVIVEPYEQTAFNVNNASFNIGFNGNNCSTHGVNYKADGVTLDYIDPLTTPPDGYQFATVTKSGQQYVVLQGEANGKYTGMTYRVDSVNGVTKWVEIVPGASVRDMTVDEINGTTSGSTGQIGWTVDGVHNDQQLIGGLSNEMRDRTAELDGLVRAAKDSANAFIDLSSGKVTGNMGTIGNPAIVYASGRTNPDGTVSEADFHMSGTQKGYGILVVEIDDPNNAQFVMSGQSMWTGLVVIVCNKNPTGNKQPLAFVGGGQDQHIIGGTFIFARNQKRSEADNASLLGVEIVKLAGNGNIRYSRDALMACFKIKPTAMEVRSWRRLSEEE